MVPSASLCPAMARMDVVASSRATMIPFSWAILCGCVYGFLLSFLVGFCACAYYLVCKTEVNLFVFVPAYFVESFFVEDGETFEFVLQICGGAEHDAVVACDGGEGYVVFVDDVDLLYLFVPGTMCVEELCETEQRGACCLGGDVACCKAEVEVEVA